MTQLYWDAKRKEIRSYDTSKMTPRQRANLVFLQGLISHEYARGFARGLEVGRLEASKEEETD